MVLFRKQVIIFKIICLSWLCKSCISLIWFHKNFDYGGFALHKVLYDLIMDYRFTGCVEKDSSGLLAFHKCEDVAEHSRKVAYESKRIAAKFEMREDKAFTAGCLHDISCVFSDDLKVSVCQELGIEILPEELIAPSLLHPKISKVMAVEMFEVDDIDVLNAIECHTTLKPNAGNYDMILFIADKMTWDAAYSQPFIDDLKEGLDKSLEHASLAYLRFLHNDSHNMKVYHPWALEAYRNFEIIC